jgi:hypothetical protein
LQQQNLRRLQLGAVNAFEIVIELFGLWTNSHLSLDFGLPSFDRFRNELKLRHFFKLQWDVLDSFIDNIFKL